MGEGDITTERDRLGEEKSRKVHTRGTEGRTTGVYLRPKGVRTTFEGRITGSESQHLYTVPDELLGLLRKDCSERGRRKSLIPDSTDSKILRLQHRYEQK